MVALAERLFESPAQVATIPRMSEFKIICPHCEAVDTIRAVFEVKATAFVDKSGYLDAELHSGDLYGATPHHYECSDCFGEFDEGSEAVKDA